MSAARPELRQSARQLSRRKLSQRAIARELGVSLRRVQQLLEGDAPLARQMHEAYLAGATTAQLNRHRERLEARRAEINRRLSNVRDELESRAVDEVCR